MKDSADVGAIGLALEPLGSGSASAVSPVVARQRGVVPQPSRMFAT